MFKRFKQNNSDSNVQSSNNNSQYQNSNSFQQQNNYSQNSKLREVMQQRENIVRPHLSYDSIDEL